MAQINSVILSRALVGVLFIAFLLHSVGFFSDDWYHANGAGSIAKAGLFRVCLLDQCATVDYPKKAAILAFLFAAFACGLASVALSALNEIQNHSKAKFLFNAILTSILIVIIASLTGFAFFRVWVQGDSDVVKNIIVNGWSQNLFLASLGFYVIAAGLNIMAWRMHVQA
jgi:hypothetical protein